MTFFLFHFYSKTLVFPKCIDLNLYTPQSKVHHFISLYKDVGLPCYFFPCLFCPFSLGPTFILPLTILNFLHYTTKLCSAVLSSVFSSMRMIHIVMYLICILCQICMYPLIMKYHFSLYIF